LREAVPVLRAAAFSVDLPPALEVHVPELRETVVSVEETTVTVVRTILFGNIELSIEEAQAIVDAGESLVFINEAWHYIDLQALRQVLANIGPEHLSTHRALPLLLAGALRIAPEAQDVQDFLREMTQPPEGELPLREVLRPYQAQGVCWLMQAATHGLGVCLADDMGLGKTLQAIAFLLTRKKPALIVAPLTVLPVWERELARWAPHLKVLRHDGPERVQGEGFVRLASAADVTITAYGYLWRDYATLRRVSWQTLILDEAQQIKNPHTRQSQAARSLPAAFRLTLTGTPIENRLEDLWSILDFLNPELFGSRKEFIERYRDPTRLRRAVSHFLLRRLKSDPTILAELPPKILQEHYAPLTSAQSAEYDLALAEYARDARNGKASGRTGAVLALLTRLKQICDGVETESSTTHADTHRSDNFCSGKINTLIPLAEEILERGESLLIFTQFARVGKRLQSILAERFGCHIPFIHGDLSAQQRRDEIERFNASSKPGIFILSLRTGAFGLTLTKANHVIHLDRWWNPAVEAQATDRVHRIGQKRTVVEHHLICRGTLEDNISRMLNEKRFLAETVVAPTPAALLARLPTDTLMGLLRRQEATPPSPLS
jgi:SNF2 family DNA or RNA helicase